MLRPADLVILETLLPGEVAHPFAVSLADTQFKEFWTEYRRRTAVSLRIAFRLSLIFANWISPLFIGKLPPLVRHGRATRERGLRAMSRSRFFTVRGLLRIMKLVVSMCYGADHRVRQAIGYYANPLEGNQL